MAETLFPLSHDLFVKDEAVKSLVGTIESYIEIWYEMHSVASAVSALYVMSGQSAAGMEHFKPKSDMSFLESVEAQNFLADCNAQRSDFQKKRDAFQEFVSQLGDFTALLFLSPDLAMSMETLLSGAVVTYVKSFNSSTGRTKLDDKKVFAGKPELQDFHENILKLRNMHFAHVEMLANKHLLSFSVAPDTGDVLVDDLSSSHKSHEFWYPIDYKLFSSCIAATRNYLKEQCSNKSITLKERLTQDQLALLREVLEGKVVSSHPLDGSSPIESRKQENES